MSGPARWTVPDDCPCIAAGESCLTYRCHDLAGCRGRLEYDRLPGTAELAAPAPDYAPPLAGWSPGDCGCLEATGVTCPLTWHHNGCKGHEIPLPPGSGGLTADDLISVLPQPDSSGLVELGACCASLGSFASVRLAAQEYRQRQLARRLGDALRELAGTAPASAAPDEPPPGTLPLQHCAGCGDLYRPQRTRSRYCSGACRLPTLPASWPPSKLTPRPAANVRLRLPAPLSVSYRPASSLPTRHPRASWLEARPDVMALSATTSPSRSPSSPAPALTCADSRRRRTNLLLLRPARPPRRAGRATRPPDSGHWRPYCPHAV